MKSIFHALQSWHIFSSILSTFLFSFLVILSDLLVILIVFKTAPGKTKEKNANMLSEENAKHVMECIMLRVQAQ